MVQFSLGFGWYTNILDFINRTFIFIAFKPTNRPVHCSYLWLPYPELTPYSYKKKLRRSQPLSRNVPRENKFVAPTLRGTR